jgi:hypothetical protein
VSNKLVRVVCPTCNGKRTVLQYIGCDCTHFEPYTRVKCQYCNGKGEIFAELVEEPEKEEEEFTVRDKAYIAIDTERAYQMRKWGTVKERPHEVGAWLTLMRVHLNDAEQAWANSSGDHNALNELRKVLALGVACAEQHGLPCRSKHIPVESKRNPV